MLQRSFNNTHDGCRRAIRRNDSPEGHTTLFCGGSRLAFDHTTNRRNLRGTGAKRPPTISQAILERQIDSYERHQARHKRREGKGALFSSLSRPQIQLDFFAKSCSIFREQTT